ncbi:MAG: type VI secretion system-associated FHA domain protein TagH [Aquabacterium sp.]|nr:type VI secretion system-associated FHA domain protein TagH [Aquabacterium sp.]
MHLLIRAVSLSGEPLTQALSAYFDERGGTIGRSDTNTLALPDPERRISRLQAELARSPDGWRMLNVGNANPIWHNNNPVPPGEGVLLDDGDELQVGSYALRVSYSQNDATARTITKGRAAVDSRTVIVGSGQEPRTDPGLMRQTPPVAPALVPAAFSAPASASPFGDLMGFGTPPAAAPPAASRLPDDFDPFADLMAPPVSAPVHAPVSASPFDLMGEVAPAGAQSLDLMFNLGPSSSSSDPLAAFLKNTEATAPSEAPAGAPSSVDPMALLASREEIRSQPAPEPDWDRSALPDDVPALQAAMPLPNVFSFITEQTVPSVRAPSPVAMPAPVAVAVPVPVPDPVAVLPTDTHALWAAFCEGAGVQFTPPQGLNPDLMRVIGQLLHHTVDGSLKLVAARAATKQEMRAEVTVIQARRNNPLKFSPDTESALEQLLQPPMRGFMSGPEAVADAMDDLLGHTIGTMVGMRAALDGVLARFQPEQLEAKLVGRSMMDSLLPMNRRAKLWELYLQHYEGVRSEAQDDFHNLFGRAFLQAYEEQLDRLEAERRQSGRHPGVPA